MLIPADFGKSPREDPRDSGNTETAPKEEQSTPVPLIWTLFRFPSPTVKTWGLMPFRVGDVLSLEI